MTKIDEQKPKFTPEQLQQLLAMQQQMSGKKRSRAGQFLQNFLGKTFQKMQEYTAHLDRFINFVTKPTDADRNDVVQAARYPILFGFYVIMIFVVFGGIWSAFAPLNSAAVASGTVVASSNKKVITHPEGGIIKDIFVKQGDQVKEGDKLLELEDIQVKARYEGTLSQYRTWLATENRLVAERDNLEKIEFSPFLLDNVNVPEVEKLIHTQENLFNSQKEVYRTEKDGLKQKILQLNKKIEALEGRKISARKTYDVLNNRVKATKTLLEKGFVQQAFFLDLEAKQANAKSEVLGVETEIATSEQEISKAEIDLVGLKNKIITSTLKELRDAQAQVVDLREKFKAHSDSLARIMIKSPVDGVVQIVNYHTIGATIGSGQPIMEISPIKDKLIIEAKVLQKNIDAVHVGLKAKIRFSAFKARTTPIFNGTVITLSPDTIQDRQAAAMNPLGGDSFYIARIEIDMDEFNAIAKKNNLHLYPGMQADVQIVTGTRTLLKYLLEPVTDVMMRAFREK